MLWAGGCFVRVRQALCVGDVEAVGEARHLLEIFIGTLCEAPVAAEAAEFTFAPGA